MENAAPMTRSIILDQADYSMPTPDVKQQIQQAGLWVEMPQVKQVPGHPAQVLLQLEQ